MEPESAADDRVLAVNTYHCLCSTLILASTHSLTSLATRAPPAQDQALVLPLQLATDQTGSEQSQGRNGGHSTLLNTVDDRKQIVVRREDGFEKRTLVRCTRCNLPVGYRLDESQFTGEVKAHEVIYILPGGLASTEEMKAGKVPDAPGWAGEAA